MSAPSPPAEDRPARLNAADSETLAVYVAELSAAGLPLAPGLRAAAEESGGELAYTLRAIAADLDRGKSLEETLRTPAIGFPRYLQGLIQASIRTGQLGEMLIDLVEHRRAAREHWRMIVSALAYPGILFAFTVAMFLTMAAFVSPVLRSIMVDFDFELPVVSLWMIQVGEYGVPLVLGLLGVVVVAALAVRFGMGAVWWRRFLARIPLLGPVWHWTAVAEASRLLSSLVKRRVALPEALLLAAEGSSDANVAAVCRSLAGGVEQGRDLAMLIAMSGRLPSSLAPLVRWGSTTGRLDEAFLAAAEMLEGRVRLRAAMLRGILPPFVFLAAASLAIALIVGFFLPLVSLIQNLA
jgi:type II secretory pathway component PulF